MSYKRPVRGPTIILLAITILLYSAHDAQPLSDEKTIFTDITQEAGITWRQFSGESPDRFLIETMGGGVAFLDFDNDGREDIFFVNGGETPHGKSPVPVRNALYRNLGNGRFEEVLAKQESIAWIFTEWELPSETMTTMAILTCSSPAFLPAHCFTTTEMGRSPKSQTRLE